MSEFTYLFSGRLTSGSPDEMQRYFQAWVAWFKALDAKGHLKERGHPLEKAGQVVMGKQKIVHDGPYAEAKDVVGGYVVVEASDLAQAVGSRKAVRFSTSVDRSRFDRSRRNPYMELDDHLFRREAGRIVSVLTRIFGAHNAVSRHPRASRRMIDGHGKASSAGRAPARTDRAHIRARIRQVCRV
jgi:hypothetical protein